MIEQVRRTWGITVRDGYGQTETTAQIGNSPGQPVKPGSMGRPLPGYRLALLDPITGEPADEGEIAIDLAQRPLGLMTGYRGGAEAPRRATARRATTARATSPRATPTATSPTSGARTISSRRRTT